MDKKHRNNCTIQKSSLVEKYYHRMQNFDISFDFKQLLQNERNEVCSPLKMDEDMQKLAIDYFIDIVKELKNKKAEEKDQKGIVAEIIMIQLRKAVGPILSYVPFSKNNEYKLGPSKLANVISVF